MWCVNNCRNWRPATSALLLCLSVSQTDDLVFSLSFVHGIYRHFHGKFHNETLSSIELRATSYHLQIKVIVCCCRPYKFDPEMNNVYCGQTYKWTTAPQLCLRLLGLTATYIVTFRSKLAYTVVTAAAGAAARPSVRPFDLYSLSLL